MSTCCISRSRKRDSRAVYSRKAAKARDAAFSVAVLRSERLSQQRVVEQVLGRPRGSSRPATRHRCRQGRRQTGDRSGSRESSTQVRGSRVGCHFVAAIDVASRAAPRQPAAGHAMDRFIDLRLGHELGDGTPSEVVGLLRGRHSARPWRGPHTSRRSGSDPARPARAGMACRSISKMPGSKVRPAMPDFSVASRSATRPRSGSPSACPPGWSQRPSLR